MPTSRLVLFAHGSRDPRWRAPFERLLATLGAGRAQGRVALAYQQFAAPTLLDAAADAARDGVTRLRLLPLFMSEGAALDRDIATRVAAVRERFPDLEVEVLKPVSEDPRFFDTIARIAGPFIP